MKSILISIHSQWVERILNGEKSIEIRKTMPKCELPCKVYIYCTKSKSKYLFRKNIRECYFDDWGHIENFIMGYDKNIYDFYKESINGMVVAEFTLNKIENYELELQDDDTYESIGKVYYDEDTGEREIDIIECSPDLEKTDFIKQSRLSVEDLRKYLGKGFQTCYAWHIDDLKIYDKPKELSEFSSYIEDNECPKKESGADCKDCFSYDKEHDTCLSLYYEHRQIKRPPQNWCYVEEINEKN